MQSMSSEYLDHIMYKSSKSEAVSNISLLQTTVAEMQIRYIEKTKHNSQNISSRLKASYLGKFYESRLKRYAFIRWITLWIWRHLFPVYLNLMVNIDDYFRGGKARRRRRLIKLSEFAKKKDIQKIRLTDAELVETPLPAVYPASDRGYLTAPHERYIFPEVFVAEISNGMVYGGTNFILAEDEVICHDLYDFEHDYTSEELHGCALIDQKSRSIRWLLNDRVPERIPVAASFVDAAAPNYAHWITEVLPRIALFCADSQFKDIPIVINDDLHENIMESLFLVTGQEREIITLPIGRALQVDSLYLTSVAGYVPFERRNTKLQGHSHGVFSPRAFKLIIDKVKLFSEKLPKQDWPEKIYIRRNSGSRKVTNAKELEDLLACQGYMMVEPEKLTFLQQAQLFNKAKSIVGSSGAALANIIFASDDADIMIAIGKYTLTSYWYWQNIACASGKKISYIFGEAVDLKTNGIHADFTIDLDNFMQVVGGKR